MVSLLALGSVTESVSSDLRLANDAHCAIVLAKLLRAPESGRETGHQNERM